jgi:vitamin B12 transporter
MPRVSGWLDAAIILALPVVAIDFPCNGFPDPWSMHQSFRFLAAAATVVLSAGAAWGQDASVIRADTVVVTASRLTKTGAELAASTTVITRKEIETTQPADAIDLLRRVPGIHVDQPGGRGGVSSIYLRGADPNYTRVMVDGVPLNDPTNSRGGSFDPSSIDLSSVERVEIVRGPLSAVQGADATAGTINFITRSGTVTPTYALDSSAGSMRRRSASAHAAGPLGQAGDIALNVAYIDDGEAIEGSRYHGKVASGKAQLAPTDASTLTVTARVAENDSSSFPDDSGGPKLAVRRLVDERDTSEASIGARFENGQSRNWTWSIEADAYRHREVFESPGVAPGVRSTFGIPVNSSESTYDRVDLRQVNRFHAADNLELAVGADTTYESGVSNSRLIAGGVTNSRFTLDRRTIGLFGEADWLLLPGWHIQGGLRNDNPQGFSSETSASVGTIYTVAETDTRLRASWREGFKLPSFFSLGNAIVGDPNLRPETSESVEAGIEQPITAADARVGVTVFRSYFYDSIDFDERTNRLVNRSEVVAWGGEIAGNWRPVRVLDLGANLSFVDTDIRDTNEELRNRPKWQAGAYATWYASDDLSLNAKLLYVGSALDSSIPTGDRKLDEYVRVDVAVNWAVTPGLDVAGAIDNLFDESYEEAVGFEAPGITPRVSVRMTF